MVFDVRSVCPVSMETLRLENRQTVKHAHALRRHHLAGEYKKQFSVVLKSGNLLQMLFLFLLLYSSTFKPSAVILTRWYLKSLVLDQHLFVVIASVHVIEASAGQCYQ